jgi:hypothetical protein
MQAGLAGLVYEEREPLAERRYLRANLPETLERPVSHRAARGAVTHLVEVVRVSDHELAVAKIEDVELDEIHARFYRCPEGLKRVLGCESRRPSVANAERPPIAPLE